MNELTEKLNFAFSEPSTEKLPRTNLTNEDMAWLIFVWVRDMPKYIHIHKELSKQLSLFQLLYLFGRFDEKSKKIVKKQLSVDEQQRKISDIIVSLLKASDEQARSRLSDKLPLHLLVFGWQESKLKLDYIRTKMWIVLMNELASPDFFDYPPDMSNDLQQMVVRRNCHLNADFIGKIEVGDILKTTNLNNKYWLSHRSTEKAVKTKTGDRHVVCTMIQNINTLREIGIYKKLIDCENLIAERSRNDPDLKKRLEPLSAEIVKYKILMSEWQKNHPTFDCQGEECKDKLTLLSQYAQRVQTLSNTCQTTIKHEHKSRLIEREGSGEKLSIKEKFQKW